jgi:hypothetical protein
MIISAQADPADEIVAKAQARQFPLLAKTNTMTILLIALFLFISAQWQADHGGLFQNVHKWFGSNE